MHPFQQNNEQWVKTLRERTAWSPKVPVLLSHSHLHAALLEEETPVVVHLFVKKGTVAQRYLNVNNDKALADAMVRVLRKRYADGSFKVEFFDTPRLEFDVESFAPHVMPQVFHLSFRESLFAGGKSHRRETLQLLNDALAGLEE